MLGVPPSIASAPPPHGALVALRGAGACLGHGCPTPLRGLPHGILTLVTARSGRAVYAVRTYPAAVAILRRDPRTGALTQLPGARGCLVGTATGGCRVLAAFRGHRAVQVLGDGRMAVAIGHHRRLLLARDPRTGRVRTLGVLRGCALAFDGPCVDVGSVTAQRFVVPASPDAALVTGYDHRWPGFAIIHRDAQGRWRPVAGAGGCVTQTGNGGRCTALSCVRDAVTTARLGDGGRVLYVGGGDADPEDTYLGYLATFRVLPGGGLQPTGCMRTPASAVPVWLRVLPDSSTVLIAEAYGNRGTGVTWERMFAARPRAGATLGRPRRISGDLTGFEGELRLAPDGRTLYDLQSESSSVEVARVSATAVRRLPAPYGLAYRQPSRLGVYGANDLIIPGNRRFAYVATSIPPDQGVRTGPAIRVYAVAR